MRSAQSLVVVGVTAMFGLSVLAAEKPPAAFLSAMKNNGVAMQRLGKASDAKDYAEIEKDAAVFKTSFTMVREYFTDKNNDDALTYSQTAFKAAVDLEAAAQSKNDKGIADARKALTSTCGACHTAHREKLQDGSFEIK